MAYSEINLTPEALDDDEIVHFSFDPDGLWITLGSSEANSYTSSLGREEAIRLRDWLISNL